MYVFANLLSAVAEVLSIALNLYMWIIIIRALLSWVNPDPYNPIVNILYRITEPVMSEVRKRLPVANMGIDLSPIVIFLIIVFLQSFLVTTLRQMAQHMY